MTDIAADITDVYAWMSADGNRVYLVLDVQGANLGATATTKFSDAVQYNFRIGSGAAFSATTTQMPTANILCKFDNATPQNFECWGPGANGATNVEYVKDAVGNTAGKSSVSGKMKVFAGYRDDPFYFNIRGFAAVGAAVKGTAGLTNDAAGCVNNINAQTSTNLVNGLKSTTVGAPGTTTAGTDDFGKNGLAPLPPGTGGMTNGNILAIVVDIDKTLLTTGGSMLSVWASTNR